MDGTADWVVAGAQQDAKLGVSVGSAGDVKHDGSSDVVVGEFLYDNGQSDEGRGHVFIAHRLLLPDWQLLTQRL